MNFDLKKHYDGWSEEVKASFKEDVIFEHRLVTYQSFYRWLSVGISRKAKTISLVKMLVEKHDKMMAGDMEPVTIRKIVSK